MSSTWGQSSSTWKNKSSESYAWHVRQTNSSLFGRKFLQRPTNNVIVHRKDTKEKGEIDEHAFGSNGSTS